MDAPLLSLADAKGWLGITDTTTDALIGALVSAASSAALRFMNRDPRRSAYTDTVSGFGGPSLPLPNYPIQSVSALTIISWGATLAGPSVDLTEISWDDNALYWQGRVFPRGKRNITVSYSAGLEPLPADITQAMRYTVRAMFDAQGIDMNSMGESYVGLGAAQWWPSGPGVIPPQAQVLLTPYRSRLRLS